ncbi:MAG: hypothetical protein KatS3mg103_0811 [Phycisphaerales bacterium]|nr:MAG: hypothetical protein KatS3mg103_0811 [Phycisphaerales bacterium]
MGQAQAVRLGIARALRDYDPDLRGRPARRRLPLPRPAQGRTQEVRPAGRPPPLPVLQALIRPPPSPQPTLQPAHRNGARPSATHGPADLRPVPGPRSCAEAMRPIPAYPGVPPPWPPGVRPPARQSPPADGPILLAWTPPPQTPQPPGSSGPDAGLANHQAEGTGTPGRPLPTPQAAGDAAPAHRRRGRPPGGPAERGGRRWWSRSGVASRPTARPSTPRTANAWCWTAPRHATRGR